MIGRGVLYFLDILADDKAQLPLLYGQVFIYNKFLIIFD